MIDADSPCVYILIVGFATYYTVQYVIRYDPVNVHSPVAHLVY